MVGLLIAFPQLVTGSLDKKQIYNMESIGEQMRDSLPSTDSLYGSEEPKPAEEAPAEEAPMPEAAEPESPGAEDDPMKAMQEALKDKSGPPGRSPILPIKPRATAQ